MPEIYGKEVSIAAADAVKLANVDVVAAYPITPQTHIVEHLAELVASGSLDADFIPVESEHSAMSVCCGSAAMGARTFTCTSSQGLALMNEVVFIAASLRLPIVMIVANRQLSAPIGIGNDHSDAMSLRDCGWIQIFCENGQDVFDHVMWAFRAAEHKEVSLPVMLNIDGFVLSHIIEPIEYWDIDMASRFLPDFSPLFRLNPNHPITIGSLTMADYSAEAKMAQTEALKSSMQELYRAWQELETVTNRQYKPLESYRVQGAETVFLTLGSISESVSLVVDELREKGKPVGQLKLRLWRPFPFEELKEAVKQVRHIIVIDRCVSYGGPPGPVAGEIRSALYHEQHRPIVHNYICGLGGRDLTAEDYKAIYQQAVQSENGGNTPENAILYGVRS